MLPLHSTLRGVSDTATASLVGWLVGWLVVGTNVRDPLWTPQFLGRAHDWSTKELEHVTDKRMVQSPSSPPNLRVDPRMRWVSTLESMVLLHHIADLELQGDLH